VLHPAKCRKLAVINAVRFALVVALLLAALARNIVEGSAAEYCPDAQSEIQTDRPDVTNSSFVVPNGSLQAENGINLTAHQASRIIDGTNTRIRLGVAHCIELLADLPDYFRSVRGRGPTGFSDVVPAVKAQLGPLLGGVVLSATAGLGLPTGASRISGHGYNPYIQFPWSRDIGGGWGLSGMFTQFWFAGQPKSNAISEATFVVEREVSTHADLFVEYVGDYPNHGGPSQVINTGGAYRFTRTQQVDFHTGFGLTNKSPTYFFGLGYSVRFDSLF
jgi:Putative MetA-pathway of phenol degradation